MLFCAVKVVIRGRVAGLMFLFLFWSLLVKVRWRSGWKGWTGGLGWRENSGEKVDSWGHSCPLDQREVV